MSKIARLNSRNCTSGTATMEKSKWQAFLESALETTEYEIACDECYDLLDGYVDMLLENSSAVDIMPAVEQHLKQCNCCAAELEALLIMLDKAVPREEEQQ